MGEREFHMSMSLTIKSALIVWHHYILHCELALQNSTM